VNDQKTEKSALCSKSDRKLPNGSKEEEEAEEERNNFKTTIEKEHGAVDSVKKCVALRWACVAETCSA
jgi:hypothetical protein